MKTIIGTFFITVVCALPRVIPYHEQQVPKEIHNHSCECIADSLTLSQCCIEVSGVMDGASGRCSFSDESKWNPFTKCCIRYKGSTSCESKDTVEGQGRYNGYSDHHQNSDDEHEPESVQEDEGHQ